MFSFEIVFTPCFFFFFKSFVVHCRHCLLTSAHSKSWCSRFLHVFPVQRYYFSRVQSWKWGGQGRCTLLLSGSWWCIHVRFISHQQCMRPRMLLMTKGGFSDLMSVFSYCCLSLVERKYSNFTLVFLLCLPHETLWQSHQLCRVKHLRVSHLGTLFPSP